MQKVLYKNYVIITVESLHQGTNWRFRIIDLDAKAGSEPLCAPAIFADSEIEIIEKAKKWIDTLQK